MPDSAQTVSSFVRRLQLRPDTLREKIMRYVRRCFHKLLRLFHQMTNLFTIHTSKFALLILFCVSAFNPSIINAVFFGMFLLLAKCNNSQMLFYWKVTLGLICAVITAQYYIRIFTKNETMEQLKQDKKSLLCLSGLIHCEKDPAPNEVSPLWANPEVLASRLYLPYLGLLLVFTLAYFILVSRNYAMLMDYYIE